MKKIVLILVLMCSATFTFATENNANDASDKFTLLDTNKDGSISKEESNADSQLAKVFENLDIDKNTLLSEKEFKAGGFFTDASQ